MIRATARGNEFLAIKPAHRDRWQLPKGTIDAGESPEMAAVREVHEEGGVSAEIIADLGPIRFWYRMAGRQYVKTVDFFLMRYMSGDPADHDHEVQEARWFPLEDVDLLAFRDERAVVTRARDLLSGLEGANPREVASPGPPIVP